MPRWSIDSWPEISAAEKGGLTPRLCSPGVLRLLGIQVDLEESESNDPASDPDGPRMPVPGEDKVLNISRLGSEENVMEVSGSLHCHPKSN